MATNVKRINDSSTIEPCIRTAATDDTIRQINRHHVRVKQNGCRGTCCTAACCTARWMPLTRKVQHENTRLPFGGILPTTRAKVLKFDTYRPRLKTSLQTKATCINLYFCSCCKCGRSSHASCGCAPTKQKRALADVGTDRLSSLLVMSIARNCSLVAAQRHY